jgi:hypothetical protein
MTGVGPILTICALQQVGRFLGYSGHQIHAVAAATHDPGADIMPMGNSGVTSSFALPASNHGPCLPPCATAVSASTTGSLNVQRGTVRMRSRAAKTSGSPAAFGVSSLNAALNSRPKP